MREKKKLLKTLLKSGFSPLEINKEGNQMRISKRNHYETKKEKFEVSYGKRF